jgi:hypothetical protein
VATIRRADVVEGEIPVTLGNEAALRRALGSRRYIIEDDGVGEGVRKTEDAGNMTATSALPSFGCEYEACKKLC